MIIYGRQMSRAARCMWVLEELGLAYTQVPINGQVGENRTPDYLALNPSGKVPVLDDDGFILRESLAINFYLAAKSDNALWPADIHDQALIYQWSSWAATEVEGPLSMIFHDRRRVMTDGGEPNTALATGCTAMAEKALTLLEDHLRSTDYVVGDRFTLGDINACSMVMLAPMFVDLSAYPKIQTWVARCAARPAWQRVEAKP